MVNYQGSDLEILQILQTTVYDGILCKVSSSKCDFSTH